MNSNFQEPSTVFKVKLTLSKSLFRMQLQARQSDFKSEKLFHTCSVATNLATSPNNSLQSAVPFWPITEQFLIHSVPSFQQHCYKQCYKQIRNCSGTHWSKLGTKSRNEERTRNTPGSSPNCLYMNHSKFSCNFERQIMNPILIILPNLMSFINFFHLWKCF